MTKIVIVGAGVIGLTTAYQLLQAGFQVSIIAQYLPSDNHIEYTSTKAGAFYIPLTSRNLSARDHELDLKSYREILKFHDTRPESGILVTKARVLIDKSDASEVADFKEHGGPWWKEQVKGFRLLGRDEFPTEDIVYGYEYDTFVITPTHYLHFLLMECIKLGLRYRRYTIAHLAEALDCFLDGNGSFSKADLVVNCSGSGAARLVPGDKKIVPVKGQTVLVENCVPYLTSVELVDPNHPDEMVYVIPRKEGGALLNGIYSYHNNSTHLDDDLTQRIIQRALLYAPELVDTSYKNNKPYLKIVSHNVGIRPGRYGSPRVELEELASPQGPVKCIHNYGNGSSGYIQSFGAAQEVLDILLSVTK